MDCREVQGFLYAYLDGEFDEKERVDFNAHLKTCPGCHELVRFEQAFHEKLRLSVGKVNAPTHLSQRIQSALASEEAGAEESPILRGLRWLIPAAAAALLLWGTVLSKNSEPESKMAEQSIEWHRRNIPMDVHGSSPDIQRFFRDKVNFAVRPPVFKLPRTQRARLMGGRLANLREHQAAYLVYQVGNRRVSVFIFDSTPLAGQLSREIQLHRMKGYSVGFYSTGGTGYAVASDMEPASLLRLVSHSK